MRCLTIELRTASSKINLCLHRLAYQGRLVRKHEFIFGLDSNDALLLRDTEYAQTHLYVLANPVWR